MRRARLLRALAPALSANRRVAAGALVLATLGGSYGLAWATGGAGVAAPHWFYLPILLAAACFGPVGAILTAVFAGLLAGPLLPLDVAEGLPQRTSDWLSRASFFIGIGALMALVIERRRKAEDALRKAELRYRTLVERIPAAVYVEEPDEPSTALYMSPRYEEITGYSPQERLADPELWVKLLHPEDREWVLAESRRTNETGDPFRVEYRLIAKGGETVWVSDEAFLVRDERDHSAFWQGVLLDITARKEAEEALVRSAERLRTLREIDRAILTSRSTEEIGRSALFRLRGLLPCDRAILVLFDPDRGTARFLAVDVEGAEGPAEGSTLPLEDLPSAEVLKETGVLRVDDLERGDGAELPAGMRERLVAAGGHSLLVAPLIAEGNVLGSVNASASSVGVFTEEDAEVLGEVADQLAIALQQAGLREELQAKAAELEELVEHLRRGDEQRRQLLHHLVRAQEGERERLAADLHDDPIQKMTAVGLRLATLKRTVGEPERLGAIGELERIVTDTVDRLRNLMFELHPPDLDRPGGLRALLRERARELAAETGADVRFEEDVREEPSTESRVIAYRIAQEALANIRKHARASKVGICVRSTGHGGVWVRISDDGVGFDLDEATDRPRHLGLTAMRERAELAGGSLDLESGQGRGTTVEFLVPGQGRQRQAS